MKLGLPMPEEFDCKTIVDVCRRQWLPNISFFTSHRSALLWCQHVLAWVQWISIFRALNNKLPGQFLKLMPFPFKSCSHELALPSKHEMTTSLLK